MGIDFESSGMAIRIEQQFGTSQTKTEIVTKRGLLIQVRNASENVNCIISVG